jgi:hypothetical protein
LDRQKGWVKGWIDKRWTVKGGIDKRGMVKGKEYEKGKGGREGERGKEEG